MDNILLKTKLYVPNLQPKLVSRPRLLERLKTGLQLKLTLIAAPAGYDKTTLLSEGIRDDHMPVGWLTLDKDDNNPTLFWSYFVSALQTIHPNIGKSVLGLLQSQQTPPIEYMTTILINEMSEVNVDFALVLDDYHMIEAQPIHDAVNFLLNHLPQQAHLVSGINYPLDEPVTIAGKELTRLGVHVYNYDPSLAPEGKTVLRVLLNSDYDYWKELRQDTERYREEKRKIANQIISLLEQRFSGLEDQVEMSDVATPMTWERYTCNWRASHEGWLMTTKNLNMRLSKTLPGLKNFFMAGQWVMPGGSLPYVAVSGRDVIQILCKKDKKPFVTTTP